MLIKLYAVLKFSRGSQHWWWWSGAENCSILPPATWKGITFECAELLLYEEVSRQREQGRG